MWLRNIAYALLASTIVAWIALEITNVNYGYKLQRFAAEYSGGGSCKWRTENGRSFQQILLAFLLVYPIAAFCLVVFASRIWRQSKLQIGSLVAILCVVLVLARFWQLGVWGAALGICP